MPDRISGLNISESFLAERTNQQALFIYYKDWLTQLWTLLQSESASWTTKGVSASSGVRYDQCSSWISQRGQILSLLLLFKSVDDWLRPTHTREGSIVSQFKIQMLVLSKIPCRHTHSRVWINIWASWSIVKITLDSTSHWFYQAESEGYM